MTDFPTTTLPSGDDIPQIGYGTWDLDDETLSRCIHAALDAGYTHIDTAEGYFNESVIGEALESANREDLFLTSKVLPKHLHYESLIERCEASLERLRTDYLDLYLIHWPNPAISLRESLAAMASLSERGLVRNVGVSNFTPYQLSCAQRISEVPIAVNQIEFHPWLQRQAYVEYCHETEVVVEAAAPLGRTAFFEDEELQQIAERYDRSVSQIALKWAIERGVVVLPRSGTPAHIRENAQLFDWELDETDLVRIDRCDRDHPVYDVGTRDWADDVWGIAP